MSLPRRPDGLPATKMGGHASPYPRYYADTRPLDDHGTVPSVLVALIASYNNFLWWRASKMRRASVPVGVPPGPP